MRSTVASIQNDRRARSTRQWAARRFRPDRVRLLLIAEAPPAALDRYFYFPQVASHDSLFRYVARLTLGREPTRERKAGDLKSLQDAGVFLIDVCPDPIADPRELRACVPRLVQRARALGPDHIILIKATVHAAAFRALRDAGLPVVDEVVPFPGSGQQLRFEAAMARALRSIRWRPAA
jgi:hypothetical protein